MIAEFADAGRYYDISDAGLGNGTPVSTLLDQSPNAAHLTAATSLPSVQHPSINGLDAVQFNNNNPLQNAEPFLLTCGFLVLRIDETTNFSNYAGILTDLTASGILAGNSGTNNFYDFQWRFPNSQAPNFEYRISDRIYPANDAPAPINAYKIIYFRAWTPVLMDGLQIGKDRSDNSRKAKMSLAFMALYSGSLCESEIRAKSLALATRYALPISDVCPLQADSDVELQNARPANLDFPASGGMIAEILGGKTIEGNLKFTQRSNADSVGLESFIDAHYAVSGFLYRSYSLLPPRDSFGYATTQLAHSGDAAGHQKALSFGFRGDRNG